MELNELLKMVLDKGASDLHLRVPGPPALRIDGVLTPQQDLPPLTPKDIKTIFEGVTTPEQQEVFYRGLELDFAHSVHGLARFRVNALRQRGTISLAFRLVPFNLKSIDELGLPQICKKIILKSKGLVLVTGATGSGKTTTMAAMIDHLNEKECRNIITIEDPIEYLHANKKSIIAQRDLGDDTKAFDIALRHALRHDPDVIVVGELRDLATISTAITAAETGRLVLGTLHTTDAARTVNRIIDIFPPSQQSQIRLQLTELIEAVISQTLLPRTGGGRIVACEVMLATPAIRNLIREGKTFEIPNVMQLSHREGMQLMEEDLAYLVSKKLVTTEDSLMKCSHPEKLKKFLELPRKALKV